MDERERIAKILNETIADIFMLDLEYVASNPELNFRKDLKASSIQYFPLISELEEQLDIELDAHDFQWKAHTIAQAVVFVEQEYIAQKA